MTARRKYYLVFITFTLVDIFFAFAFCLGFGARKFFVCDWFKAIFLERKEKNDPIKTDFILSLGAAYGVVPYSEKEGGGNKAKEDLTAYRLAYPDDIVMNSMNIISGSVGISKYFGCVSPVYYMLYPRIENVNSDYFCYLFHNKHRIDIYHFQC